MTTTEETRQPDERKKRFSTNIRSHRSDPAAPRDTTPAPQPTPAAATQEPAARPTQRPDPAKPNTPTVPSVAARNASAIIHGQPVTPRAVDPPSRPPTALGR